MENKYILALLKCKGIGNKKLLDYVRENSFDINKIINNIKNFINEDDYKCFELILKEAEEEIKQNTEKGIKLITILSENFPSKLYSLSDPIIYLYYYGDISLLKKDSVGIIGTRKPTEQSIEDTKKITEIISKKYVTVSGLALGIDTIGHRTTIDSNGKTIAVLPSSIDNIQPASNKELAKDIINTGGLIVSEYSTGTKIATFNYAKRDRIQAALSDTLIVPEAEEKSGTMIAVEHALNQGKKVYQLKNNKNSKIPYSISLEDDILEIIFDAVNHNKTLKKNIIDKSVKEDPCDQLALF